MTTHVLFKKFPEGDVIALFPYEKFNLQTHNTSITSYMHLGQHGAADSSLTKELADASPIEYKKLLEELQEVGYNDLCILNT